MYTDSVLQEYFESPKLDLLYECKCWEEDVRKGIGDIMGGKVLELESERLKAEGLQEGMIAGAIKTCRKFKLDQEAAIGNVMEEFFLSKEDASNYVKKYW